MTCMIESKQGERRNGLAKIECIVLPQTTLARRKAASRARSSMVERRVVTALKARGAFVVGHQAVEHVDHLMPAAVSSS
jgi:hypothetical protein